MLIEQTMELISEFRSFDLRTKSDEDFKQSELQVRKDPDYFSLTKTKYEINKTYLELITASLEKNGGHDDTDIVIDNTQADYRVTRGSLKRLNPGQWFNDEIVNGYISLINQRDKALNQNSVFCFNTFFYTMLEGRIKRGEYDYTKLVRVL
jgi:Ulp1 family protease